MELHSAALHDAAPLALHMPAAMLFIPSIGGVSHSYDEHTVDKDLAAGAEAYVRAAVGMALGECESQHGPTCIVGDARRNVRLADPSWLEALAQEEEERPLASDDPDDYPDL